MRLLVNCPSGESRLLQIDDAATVLELKQVLMEAEGIPVPQQVLCFAGQHLKDHLPLSDHHLEDYILSDEAVLYLSKKLANPKRILLGSRDKAAQTVAELVEADMAVGGVMALLESRSMAAPFRSNAEVLCKRQDGSTIRTKIEPSETIADFEARITSLEGVSPTCLTFRQAQDGHMHINVWPSAQGGQDTYPVTKRSVVPQPVMLVTHKAQGVPLNELVHELCVLP